MAQSHGKCDSHMIDLLPQFYCFRTIGASKMRSSGRKHDNLSWTLVGIVKFSTGATEIEFFFQFFDRNVSSDQKFRSEDLAGWFG